MKERKKSQQVSFSAILFNRKFGAKLAQAILLSILALTILINIFFIIDSTNQLLTNNNTEDGADVDDDDTPRAIHISMVSSSDSVRVSVNDSVILDTSSVDGASKQRGIHVLVLNEHSGSVMAARVFDTYSPHEDEQLALFLQLVLSADRENARIILMLIQDEGTFGLKNEARQLLACMGSKHALTLGWRDTWCFVSQKKKKLNSRQGVSERPLAVSLGESVAKSASFDTWGAAVALSVTVPLAVADGSLLCPEWDNEGNGARSDQVARRRDFCSRVEGYGSVCSCSNHELVPSLMSSSAARAQASQHELSFPIIILASNRPHYLFTCLSSLLALPELNNNNNNDDDQSTDARSLVTVFIDGYYDEPLAVARLFGLRAIQHSPTGGSPAARISQHVKASLTATFSHLFPRSEATLVLEEDLEFSPDFLSFFRHFFPLFSADSTIYCLSAWNDLGYSETVNTRDPGLVYRTESMPGLGWMVTRALFERELEPKWPSPERAWDWDMWLRLPSVRKGRECVVPDISRSFHFGSIGANMNSFFHENYFKNHAFWRHNKESKFMDWKMLTSQNYESLIEREIKKARIVEYSESNNVTDCSTLDGLFQEKGRARSFKSDDNHENYLLFIRMADARDTSSWISITRCYKMWDLDARGSHHGLWRFWTQEGRAQILVIGVPYSRYAHHKPESLDPMIISVPTRASSSSLSAPNARPVR